MDAASPVSRWLFAISLIALAGCKDTSTALNARGQAPAELPGPLMPAPLAPLAPPQPIPPVGPVNSLGPIAPVQGYPVGSSNSGAPVVGMPIVPGPVIPASMVALAPERPKFPDQNSPTGFRDNAKTLSGGLPQVKVVALVGVSANLVTDQEVMEEVRKHLGDYRNLDGDERKKKEKELYREELGKIIGRELILDDLYLMLKKQNKSIEDIREMAAQEAEMNLRAYRKEQSIRTEQEFIEVLRAQGLTLPGLRRQMERQNMADMYIHGMLKDTGRNPGFAEIRRYYELHQDQFQIKDRVKWQDLFINVSKFASIDLARAHAEQIRQKALSGVDFVSLIKAEENSPQGRQNWDGIGTTPEDVPLDVGPTVFALAPGQISEIVTTETGYHIIKVLEREKAGVKPLDEKVQNTCREKLKKMYRDADAKKMIQDLWRKGTVQVFDID